MSCCQCDGVRRVFNDRSVRRELRRYRKKGPVRTTRRLIRALKPYVDRNKSLLDIGGGLGAIAHALLDEGVERVVAVDASPAYIAASESEAERRGVRERFEYHLGDYVDVAEKAGSADVVTLDRVICCYPDMRSLVTRSAGYSRNVYALVFPRGRAVLRYIFRPATNCIMYLTRNPFRFYLHPTGQVEAILQDMGFMRKADDQTYLWQIRIYTRT